MRNLPLMTRRRYIKGFTLIEIMVAVTLLSVGLLGMAGLTVGIMRGNSLSNQVTTATALAQAKMEDIKRVGYSGASILVLFGALRLKRVTWTVIGLGSLGVYVVRLLVETLGPDASYALTAIGILLVVAALYMRRRAQGRRITNA